MWRESEGVHRSSCNWNIHDGTVPDVGGFFACFPCFFDLSQVTTKEVVDIVKWVRAADFPWLELKATLDVLDKVVSSGHYELVEWLRTHTSGDWTTNVMDCAAGRGHLEIIKFLQSN